MEGQLHHLCRWRFQGSRELCVLPRAVPLRSTCGGGIRHSPTRNTVSREAWRSTAPAVSICTRRPVAAFALPFRGRMSRKESSNGTSAILISSPVARTANCHHLDRKCMRCSAHKNRPVPCRAYDCRQDKCIWSNFEGANRQPRSRQAFSLPRTGRRLRPNVRIRPAVSKTSERRARCGLKR